ncbi:MAG: biotin/lipoyl-containing protein [Thermoplasmatota archaeon]
MRYSFQLGNRLHHVHLIEHGSGPQFVVDGETFQPQVQSLGQGRYKVTLDGAMYDFTVRNGRVLEGPRPLDLEVRRARPVLERSAAAGRKKDGRVKPPMPGKIVEVKVKEGQAVAEGEVLLVLEAMKMQNDLKAPMAGTVRRVLVADGTNVEAGTVLVEIEPA